MTQTSLPAARAAFIDQNGRPTPQFYRFLETLATAQLGNLSAGDLDQIEAQIEALQSAINGLPSAGYPRLDVQFPIKSQGLLQNGYAKLLWAGTTSDVPEGSNLYFTDARAYAAAKARLQAGDGVSITPDDDAETLTIAASATGGRSIPQAWVFA